MKCIGATCGDCIGFPMEFIQSHKFINYQPFSMGCRFTDDTVMTIATMAWLLSDDLSHKTKLNIWLNMEENIGLVMAHIS